VSILTGGRRGVQTNEIDSSSICSLSLSLSLSLSPTFIAVDRTVIPLFQAAATGNLLS